MSNSQVADAFVPPPPGPEADAALPCAGGGRACELPNPSCGDGVINQAAETCDDGNLWSGDGCSTRCLLEDYYVCPTPGEPCISTVTCGDGRVEGRETCDDGNRWSFDGCDGQCAIEAGWNCPRPGQLCEANRCGDGIVAGQETCDPRMSSPGCIDCQLQVGYSCDSEHCNETACQNGIVEPGEQCEDTPGDAIDEPFDGCFRCRLEPRCSGGVCASSCGDGQRFADEACDDGNLQDGDGCSSDCEVERGFSCMDIHHALPNALTLPVLVRDFIGRGNSLRDPSTCYDPAHEGPSTERPRPCYHVDFNQLTGPGIQGCLLDTLDAAGRPQYHPPPNPCADYWGADNSRPNLNGAEAFSAWYNSNSPDNIPVVSSLPLQRVEGTRMFVFDATNSFYPLDRPEDGATGWVARGEERLSDCTPQHNNHFTTETRFWFEYQGGEHFAFAGDDDTWVFVNGQLVIDLGGLHGSLEGMFSLDPIDGSAHVTTSLQWEHRRELQLTLGGVYEVAVFQAERNQCGSNFKLTLQNFSRPRSLCVAECGDGLSVGPEQCDEGPFGNQGAYGECLPDCSGLGPHCGDGVVQSEAGEVCDDGFNLSLYGGACGPDCSPSPSCGDGSVQGSYEQCDEGEANNTGSYDGCTPQCMLGPHCGDGEVQADFGETCDDGNRLANDGCSARCVLEPMLL